MPAGTIPHNDRMDRHRAIAAETQGSMVGHAVMILHRPRRSAKAALAMLEDGLFTRFPKPD